MPSQLLFLPGALGRTQLWDPVARLLAHPAEKHHVGWPGFGATPPDPRVRGIDDLVARVAAGIVQPRALIAEQMIGAARHEGYASMCLDVLPEFVAAQQLYDSLDFRPAPAVSYNPIVGTRFLALNLRESDTVCTSG